MNAAALIETANHLSRKGRGILAADESTGTIGKRLEKAGLVNDEETRRRYRELFFTAPGMGTWMNNTACYSLLFF
jgi:fructose-bisphosphate aldolase, class I